VRDIGKELCVENAIPEAVLSFLLLVALLDDASIYLFEYFLFYYILLPVPVLDLDLFFLTGLGFLSKITGV
jgi:hypothetical protein